jgi:arsenate reductase
MMVVGIKNCSTVKKALIWSDSHQIQYEFYDLKQKALNKVTLTKWFKNLPNHLT